MMDTEIALRQAVSAAKAGRKEEARHLLETVLAADERNERAWLWMSGVVDSDEERVICLENVLTINPNNDTAREGLLALEMAPAADQSVSPYVSQIADEGDPPAESWTASHTEHQYPTEVASGHSSASDRRPFIIITIVLALMLICTVVSILAFVLLSPVR